MSTAGGYLLQENGGKLLLENGKGFLILEGPRPSSGNLPFGIILPRDMAESLKRRRKPVVDLDDETLAMILMDEL